MVWLLGAGLSVFMAGWFMLVKKDGARGNRSPQDILGNILPKSRLPQSFMTLEAAVATFNQRVQQQAQAREAALEVPELIDIVTMGLQAGLSFDAALDLYTKRRRTQLACALGEAKVMWQLGLVGRDEALQALAATLNVPMLTRFAATVQEALAFGMPLAARLRRQAHELRQEERARIEEAIERAPVKMLIPLGVLLVPAMLIAILGPLLGGAFSGVL